jgi:hypothetical protein
MSRPYGRVERGRGGATGTIRSESVLTKSTGTDGRLSAAQFRGFAVEGGASFAVFGFPRGRWIPGGEPFTVASFAAIGMGADVLPASEDTLEERPDGGRAAVVKVCWYQ